MTKINTIHSPQHTNQHPRHPHPHPLPHRPTAPLLTYPKLDLIDKKILTELDKNSRQSNNHLAKSLRISREKIDYRIKQLVSKHIIKKFPTIINPTSFGYSMHKLYFQFQHLTPEKEQELIHYLKANPYVQWITTCKGKWDMNIIIFAHNVEHFNQLMQEFYTHYGHYILTQNFNISLAVGNMQKGWILKEKYYYSTILYTANDQASLSLDKTDLEILKIIGNNARMSVVDIAKKINATARIVQYKLKTLEKNNVIKGYTISLDYTLLKKQFYKVIFYINVLDTQLKNKLIEYCRKQNNMPYFVFCVGEWPFEVEYVVDDIEEFYKSVEDIKTNFPQIKRYESILLAKEYKFDFLPMCYTPEK